MSAIDHPAHYGGDTTYETIKVAEAWGLDDDAYLFNVLKYISRAGKKGEVPAVEDLQKAAFYLQRRITRLTDSEPAYSSSKPAEHGFGVGARVRVRKTRFAGCHGEILGGLADNGVFIGWCVRLDGSLMPSEFNEDELEVIK